MTDNKRSSLFCAITWSLCLFMDIINASAGGTPTWALVFCPLTMLVLHYWIDYILHDE